MISNLLDELKEAFDALRVAGGALEGVRSVRVGDLHPISDREMPCITLDCSELPVTGTGSATGSRYELTYRIEVALFTSDARPGYAQRALWGLIGPPSLGSPRGLQHVLNTSNQLRLSDGSLFHLRSGPIRLGAIRERSVFTAGAVATVTATTWTTN